MNCTLNQAAWEKLIDEDLGWLESMDRTLEREHIKDVLRWVRENKRRISEDSMELYPSILTDVQCSELLAIAESVIANCPITQENLVELIKFCGEISKVGVKADRAGLALDELMRRMDRAGLTPSELIRRMSSNNQNPDGA